MLSNQEIWTGSTQQDPKSFTERFTVLKDQKMNNNNPIKTTKKNTMKKQSSAKPKQKMGSIKPIVQYPQGEDYIEDEIDESVQIAKPKNMDTFTHSNPQEISHVRNLTETNVMNKINPTMVVDSHNTHKLNSSIKMSKTDSKQRMKTQNQVKSNGFSPNKANGVSQFYNATPINAMQNMNINPNNVQSLQMNNMQYPNVPNTITNPTQKEINFININISPNNARFTQNIYMNFPTAMNPVISQPNLQPVVIPQPQPVIVPQQTAPIPNYNYSNINNLNPQPQSVNSQNNKIKLVNIIIGSDKRTTLMLRNIPNKYTLNNIVDEIGSAFWGKYDCINLPIDYETKLNLGYAFINFTDPLHIIQFFSKFHLKKWSRYKSEKKMDMTYADKQGKKDITLKAENNYFAQDDKRFDFKTIKTYIEIPCVRLFFLIILHRVIMTLLNKYTLIQCV